jgi:hypothetical protein
MTDLPISFLQVFDRRPRRSPLADYRLPAAGCRDALAPADQAILFVTCLSGDVITAAPFITRQGGDALTRTRN